MTSHFFLLVFENYCFNIIVSSKMFKGKYIYLLIYLRIMSQILHNIQEKKKENM